jgi:hypothetical protein
MVGRMKCPLFLALLLAGAAQAQALVDPMRPATGGYGEAEVVAARTAGPMLEQVVLGGGRNFAVINGRRVAVGEKFGDSTVVRIEPDQVTLRGDTTQVLRMFPHADRKSAGAGPAPQRRKAGEG